MSRDGLHARLRAATDPAHRALETSLDWQARVATLGGYRDLLGRLYGFHAVWESAIGSGLADEPFLAPRRRLALLAADLDHLGLPASAVLNLPPCHPDPASHPRSGPCCPHHRPSRCRALAA
ncbi:biliverdin-producing heme oxygenase [Methylobacterium oryzae]|uniref:biliverdin-producing heme oxygenase n=1 Tax=Methylobacterium oryzae TaxID=334852 RepID=UPI002F35DB04